MEMGVKWKDVNKVNKKEVFKLISIKKIKMVNNNLIKIKKCNKIIQIKTNVNRKREIMILKKIKIIGLNIKMEVKRWEGYWML
jgi:hypothetical protein